VNLELILKAVDAASVSHASDASDAALRAASALPADASDFDRGMAAGMALQRYLDQSDAVRVAA
jgi:hypothetical protein